MVEKVNNGPRFNQSRVVPKAGWDVVDHELRLMANTYTGQEVY